MLEERLAILSAPESVLNCRNVHCQDSKHKEDLDQFTLELLETVQTVAEDTLPVPARNLEKYPADLVGQKR